LKDMDFHPPL